MNGLNNNNMEKEFVPYKEALELKALGFDEPCIAFYEQSKRLSIGFNWLNEGGKNSNLQECTAPTFSQAFRWFRKKYVLFHSIIYLDDNSGEGEFSFEILNKKGNQQQNGEYFEYNSYEEAELACLRKLIEIVKTK